MVTNQAHYICVQIILEPKAFQTQSCGSESVWARDPANSRLWGCVWSKGSSRLFLNPTRHAPCLPPRGRQGPTTEQGAAGVPSTRSGQSLPAVPSSRAHIHL